MIKKSKIELKRGIACLLATLQIGFVAGCNQKDISESEYSDVKTFILASEQMCKNIKNKTKLDLTYNVDILNKNLISKIGITDEMLELPIIKDNINKFNEYLRSYIESYYNQDDLYYVVFDEVDGKTVLSILNSSYNVICSVAKVDDYVYFNYHDLGMAYNDETDQSFNYSMFVSSDSTIYEKGWYFNENYYFIHSHNTLINDNMKEESAISYYATDLVDPEEPDFKFTFENDGRDSYDLTFKRFNKNVNFKISRADYLILTDLMEAYKENGVGDILAYFKETLILIIQKYDKQDECQEFLNILKGHQTRVLK